MGLKTITISDLPEEGLKLDHRLLYRLNDKLVNDYIRCRIAWLLDAFYGSRVDVYLVPGSKYYSHAAGIQLRCGEIHCDYEVDIVIPDYIIELAPFIAACAGQAIAPETVELKKLQDRVERLEQAVGISD